MSHTTQTSPTPTPIARAAAVLAHLVGELVDAPELVTIAPLEGMQAVIFEVKVAPPDVRRIIGRRGRTANAVREILGNLGSKAGKRYSLEIVEPDRPAPPHPEGADDFSARHED